MAAVSNEPQIRTLELFRGLAQRTNPRKTSYLDALFGLAARGKLSLAQPSVPPFLLPVSPHGTTAAGRKVPPLETGNETILRDRRNQPETNEGYISVNRRRKDAGRLP